MGWPLLATRCSPGHSLFSIGNKTEKVPVTWCGVLLAFSVELLLSRAARDLCSTVPQAPPALLLLSHRSEQGCFSLCSWLLAALCPPFIRFSPDTHLNASSWSSLVYSLVFLAQKCGFSGVFDSCPIRRIPHSWQFSSSYCLLLTSFNLVFWVQIWLLHTLLLNTWHDPEGWNCNS